MKFFEIVLNVTERRTYVVAAANEHSALNRIYRGEVLPQAVKVTHQDEPFVREVALFEPVGA
jgi:hypothetical protein